MEIVLIRHGRPAFAFSRRVPASELQAQVAAYDACTICDTPPKAAIDVAQRCAAVVCSDLTRSLHSARALQCKEIALADALFREAGFPHAQWRWPPLPVAAWAVLFRALWVFGFSQGGESVAASRQRAQTAARRLAQLARERGSVLFVGHGIINRYIADALIAQGWNGPRRPGVRYWGHAVYRLEAA